MGRTGRANSEVPERRAMKVGILTGGGDCPGLNRCDSRQRCVKGYPLRRRFLGYLEAGAECWRPDPALDLAVWAASCRAGATICAPPAPTRPSTRTVYDIAGETFANTNWMR